MGSYLGKVIKIPNEFTLVVRLEDGKVVKPGDLVDVFMIAGEVVDPETNENLGELSFSKDTLTVVSTDEKFFIAQKFTKGTMALAPILREAIAGRPVKINVDENQNEHVTASDSPIQIGDLVKLVN